MRPPLITVLFWSLPALCSNAALLSGKVVDAATGAPLPARLYVQEAKGKNFFAVQSPTGQAIFYGRTNSTNRRSIEAHTTLSADPFQVDLSSGTYWITAERGHEYRPAVQRVELKCSPERGSRRRISSSPGHLRGHRPPRAMIRPYSRQRA
jgi:hypothetical protein